MLVITRWYIICVGILPFFRWKSSWHEIMSRWRSMKKGNSINSKKQTLSTSENQQGLKRIQRELRSQAQVDDSEKLKCGMGKEISLSTQLWDLGTPRTSLQVSLQVSPPVACKEDDNEAGECKKVTQQQSGLLQSHLVNWARQLGLLWLRQTTENVDERFYRFLYHLIIMIIVVDSIS